ncbi:hypothetical protein B0H16DRAFT_1434875 [Mycena metata]|uniref:Novel STAND NTPase 1 domain-containing protein n=1 Tax=Mycena metata TaxID=1033252 RepID=A0AAD7H9X0_9AGAR|nr:hypothetical protein B0H16DRAFT_1434875 [Mycena metata]
MPRQQTIMEVRLEKISKCVTITVDTLDILVTTLKIPGLEAMVNTIQSLLKLVQTIKQDKNECAELMEQTHNILNAIIGVYVKSDTGIELPPSTLHEIANFTQTLHKIHTFIEAQQSGSKVKKFFRQGELNGLLKDCKTGLQEGIKFFQIKSSDIMSTAREMEEQAQIRHQEMLNAIETISSSDSASSISRMYSGSYASSNSISMLPAEPKIFHGRESELAYILKHFEQSTPRIAILGAGGMGKTSLAQAVLHHEEIVIKYQGNQFFVVCDTAASKVELAGLIGDHLGMKSGKDLTQAVLFHLSEGPPTLLILDNLETVWEPAESRKEVEEFLSLLTDITSLALMVCILISPTDEMIGPLFKHFRELLQAYVTDQGKQSAILYVQRLTSNYTNIQNIIQNRLHPEHPDLADSISCTSHFIRFDTSIGKYATPLVDKVITLLPHSEDHRAKASFTVRLFGILRTHSIPHPEALIVQTLEWLKTFNDPDLEGMFTFSV